MDGDAVQRLRAYYSGNAAAGVPTEALQERTQREGGGRERERERDVGGRECVCACERERQRARVCDVLDLRSSFTAVCVQVIIPVGWGGYNQRQCFHVFTDFITI